MINLRLECQHCSSREGAGDQAPDHMWPMFSKAWLIANAYMLLWADTIRNPVKLKDEQQKDGPGVQISDNEYNYRILDFTPRAPNFEIRGSPKTSPESPLRLL